MQSKNSVFIYLRRVYYVKLGWRLKINYYKNAIKYMLENVCNPTFLYLVQLIMFLQSNLKSMVVFENLSERNITLRNKHQDLFLMSYCKYAIITNSSLLVCIFNE